MTEIDKEKILDKFASEITEKAREYFKEKIDWTDFQYFYTDVTDILEKFLKENFQVDCIPRNCGGCLHNIHDFIILTNSPCRDCCRSKAYQDLYIKKEVDKK